ncbi:hypothetical protein GCM10023115_02960 [Pontixanthobacter gangjinensis]|uniref:Uncharacterized protein n=1 Tax=Pontixanthobacter gangjinensis TaxID=1028742 RepID=A0A6I4SIN0_9SPHN|nr:hypothetical protein [Pontixanthobacter gangjinensis]MXO55549.1 hypothetical protein [Pontixanthobacter gangjinensis]
MKLAFLLTGSAVIFSASAALANEKNTSDDGTLVIDILVPMASTADEDAQPLCEAPAATEKEGAEIIVCGELLDDSAYYYSGSRAAALDRYAEETAFAGDIAPPNVAGPGIFTGPATIAGMCGFIFNPCPPPAAYLIDFSTLPDAPAGSDADLISRGLAPAGKDEDKPRELTEFERKELGLPPALVPPAISLE